MKKPVVNYKNFRLSKINDPEFSHLKLLAGWIIYFALYFITENFIPAENCYIVHSKLDDIIPFCEIFVIPYVFWYFLIAGSLIYFALYNTDNFKNLMKFIIITQVVAMAVYIIIPNRQDLRPVEFARDNIFTDIVSLLYFLDTDTNVCPSLHVAYSIGIASVWLKEESASKWMKAFVVIAAILISLSTAFIKQHSIVDAFAASILCVFAELIVFGRYWVFKLGRRVSPDK
ncbi:MAG: phosphatidic acid phosphatase [Clostridia bacterium]|nr:phosphatidic acid phosphatase [Clostridia bacterium]